MLPVPLDFDYGGEAAKRRSGEIYCSIRTVQRIRSEQTSGDMIRLWNPSLFRPSI
jgi:hypothetical protein